MTWETEVIPDVANVFTRIHKNFVSSQDGQPKKTAFQNTPIEGDDLSCDWDKHFDENQAWNQIEKEHNARKEFKNKNDYFMWSFSVQKLRAIDNPKQEVKHRPIYHNPEVVGTPNNRAHSGIFGTKPQNDAKLRSKFLKCGKWTSIRPPEDTEITKIDLFIDKIKDLNSQQIITYCSQIVENEEHQNVQSSKYLGFVKSLEMLLTNTYKAGGISPDILQKAEPILDWLIEKGEIDIKLKEKFIK